MNQLNGQRPDLGGRSTVSGRKGAVACEHPQAALTGIRILDAGGNAADACVAMAAMMAVVSPMSTGMGGDAFLLFHESKNGRVLGANGSGRAPQSATVQKLRDRGVREMPERGPLTVTVPGAVRLWEDTASSLGRLPLFTLLEPAREAAEEGNPVAEVVARYWQGDEELLARDKAATETFLPKGRAPQSNEVFHQRDLARTIEAVMEDGADAFYKGEAAESIVRSVQRGGGYLEEADLAAHETSWVEPIATDYRGVIVHEIPPPGQGIAALEMLNIVEGYDLQALSPLSAERIHLEAEAKKLAYSDLYECVGDPEFSEIPTKELLSKEYAAKLREQIFLDKAGHLAEPVAGTDTTYLCAVDAEGNGCSFINSLYMRFGSGVVAEGTGVCLHNRGYSFHLEEGHPNALAPGKLPLHTIIPGLATKDGRLWATFGVMGGPMQPQGHAQLLANLIDYGMSPQQAVDHPRHFHNSGTLLLEDRLPEKTVRDLRRLGHSVRTGAPYEIPVGGAQIIRVLDDGIRACGSDPRKDGCALAQ